jgi:hypothetical protein
MLERRDNPSVKDPDSYLLSANGHPTLSFSVLELQGAGAEPAGVQRGGCIS